MSERREDASRDSKLLELIEDLGARYRGGEAPDVDGAARSHPELADELRTLWSAYRMAEEAGALESESTPWTPRASSPGETSSSPIEGVTTTVEGVSRDVVVANGDEMGVTPPPSLPRRFGEYELIEELGRGGMGVVYRARHEALRRTVALKMILRGEFASTEDIERFFVEARAAATLDHPNIVTVFDVGSVDGQPYFTMQLVEGESLADRIAGGPLAAREAASLLAPICRAVDYAHRNGVLHRDLKPQNILIDHAGRPYVTDFGLAKRLEHPGTLTRTGAIVGSPAYMSPEQAAGSRGHVTATSDVYSLGTVLYHALCGRTPFDARSPIDCVMQVLEQDPPLPRTVYPQVDRDLEMVVLKCLQKPQDMRYPSAAALAGDMDRFLADEPVSARSGSFLQVVSRLFRETHHAGVLENWGLLWIWHSVVLLVLCGITQWIHGRGQESIWVYLGIWGAGLGAWAAMFWALRRRSGPVTFVERQIAHIWGASVISCSGLFILERLLSLPTLRLSPVLGLISGTVFLSKAGILSGKFYVQAVALFLTAPLMALFPDYGLIVFGVVAAACFFVPGWKYWRQRRASR